MRPLEQKRRVITGGTSRTGVMDIDRDDLPKILSIVSDKLYNNRIAAVIREYSCNAWDAHIEGGCPDKPIEVILPSSQVIEVAARPEVEHIQFRVVPPIESLGKTAEPTPVVVELEEGEEELQDARKDLVSTIAAAGTAVGVDQGTEEGDQSVTTVTKIEGGEVKSSQDVSGMSRTELRDAVSGLKISGSSKLSANNLRRLLNAIAGGVPARAFRDFQGSAHDKAKSIVNELDQRGY